MDTIGVLRQLSMLNTLIRQTVLIAPNYLPAQYEVAPDVRITFLLRETVKTPQNSHQATGSVAREAT